MYPKIQLTNRGMSLIEVTLVIAVLLGLISVTFLGAASYKSGSNRAMCIQNIANTQKAIRSFSNLYEVVSGSSFEGLRSELYGSEGFLPVEPTCPSQGEYSFLEDEIPALGTLYLTCSIPSHAPTPGAVW